MTYDEKLQIIIAAINEARQFSRKGQGTLLRLGTGNGLGRINIGQIHDILLQLQDDEKIIIIQEVPTELKVGFQKSLEEMEGKVNYFSLDILDNFDDWHNNFLIKQKGKLQELTYLNLLRILHAMLYINEQIQVHHASTVTIPLMPQRIYFQELMPADTVGIRDEFAQGVWDAMHYLKAEGIISDFRHIDAMMHRWDNSVEVVVNAAPFYDFLNKIKAEVAKRIETTKSSKKADEKEPAAEIASTTKVSYEPTKGLLHIGSNVVKFDKDSFRAKLLELILKDEKNQKKEWSYDEVIEKIEAVSDLETIKEMKKKFYPACDGISKFVAQKIGINDLLIYNKTTVQVNQKYL